MDMRRYIRKHWKRALLCVCLTLVAIAWVSPVFFGVFSAFKTSKEFKQFGKLRNVLPIDWTMENFVWVWENASNPLPNMIVNSLIVSIAQVALCLFVASAAAYAYERLDFPHKEKLFWALFGMGMIPGVIALVPQYLLYDAVGLTDTLWVLITPYVGNVFNVFLLRNFLHGIPYDLDEAARIDGANDFIIYSRILLPCLYPAMTVVALFTFTEAWNDLMWPSLAITTPSRLTIAAGIRLLNDAHGAHLERVLAACVISIIPTFVIYLFTRKYFLQGLSLGAGIKG